MLLLPAVAVTADFNGDGFGDLLWRDTSGNTAVWLMKGAAVISSAGLGVVPPYWTVAGTGDFNGDGNADILWRDNGPGRDIVYPLSHAREIVVTFNCELPAGRAEVPSLTAASVPTAGKHSRHQTNFFAGRAGAQGCRRHVGRQS
jgi:hypothetical protein